ncbi:MAG: 16S rRNA (uracil(1498)-N(3))-methyltransferase [Corynebacteriales bacterium]|nr:16S rRNA (uracil(1498)-N(3))-methyltransferase [Mycobacteriales bacterium]
MSLPLFVLDSVPDIATLVLSGDEGHHAARVQRLTPGARLLITDGRGLRARCVVESVNGGELNLRVELRDRIPAPQPKLIVVQALPKGDRGELAVELMTELDVDEIVPWSAARTITQWRGPRGDKALAKWRNAARAAAKQSRRSWFPDVSRLASTSDVVRRIGDNGGPTFVLHEEADITFFDVASSLLSEHSKMDGAERGAIMLIVGPEGGLDDREVAQFSEAGAKIVRFGATVVRTSTAGPAALAALAPWVGRWR